MDADITKTGKLIHRRDAETQSFLKSKSKSAEGASQSGLAFERQVRLLVLYKGLKLDCGYRLDLVVEESVIIEIKTVDQLLPIHSAQLLTYLKLSSLTIGLLLNFNEPTLKRGIKRLVNQFREPSAKPVTSAPSARETGDDASPPSHTESLKDSASPRLCGEPKS